MNEETLKKLKDYIDFQRKLYKPAPFLTDYEDGVHTGVNDTVDEFEDILKGDPSWLEINSKK